MDMEAFAKMTPAQQELYQYNYNQMLNGQAGFGLDAVSDSMGDLDIVATGHLSYEATVTNAILERDSTLTISAKHDFNDIYPRYAFWSSPESEIFPPQFKGQILNLTVQMTVFLTITVNFRTIIEKSVIFI